MDFAHQHIAGDIYGDGDGGAAGISEGEIRAVFIIGEDGVVGTGYIILVVTAAVSGFFHYGGSGGI